MENNRPRRRQKNVTEGGAGVHKRGEGLGTGKVGSSSGQSSGQQQNTTQNSEQQERNVTRSGGGGKLIALIAIAALLLGGGGGLSSLLGGGGNNNQQQVQPVQPQQQTQPQQTQVPSTGALPIVQNLFNTASPQTTSTWTDTANTGNLNTSTSKPRERNSQRYSETAETP